AAELAAARAPEGDPLALVARAEIALKKGRDAEALAYLAHARRAAPQLALPRVRAALVLLDNGDPKGAAEELLGLDDPASLTRRGACFRAAGDAPGALAAYQAALGRDADRPEALFDLALLYRDALQKPALALETFRRYLAVEGRALKRTEEANAAMRDL